MTASSTTCEKYRLQLYREGSVSYEKIAGCKIGRAGGGGQIHAAERLSAVEALFHSSWTGSGSTPFIVDIQPPRQALYDAIRAAKEIPLQTLFRHYPTLAVWTVLYPLSHNYGVSTKDVYLHISAFVGENFDDVAARDQLKHHFRTAARSLGLPVSGNHPTALFFAPLGPAMSQHDDLARAFVGGALYLGSPAIEDTSAARNWQRRVVKERCPNLTRLREAIFFDTSAHCARRFEAWRQGAEALSEAEAHLFAAYDRATRLHGRTRRDLVGLPRLFWFGDRLGLQVEASRQLQSIQFGAFPTQVLGGQRIRVPAPWPDRVTWRAGIVQQEIPFAPAADEVLIFDADSGSFLSRIPPEDSDFEAAAEHFVVLSRSAFTSPSFGDAIPTADPMVMAAWISRGETLTFPERGSLTISAPREAAVWIDGSVLGRDGSRALYACDGTLLITIDPEIGGRARIVRARTGDETRFISIEVGADGDARLPFSQMGFDQPGSPSEVTFELLAPGAAGDPDARAELSTTSWIWPGVSAPERDLTDVAIPANLDPARSAGLRILDGLVSVDPRSDVEVPILGLSGPGRVHEFHLVARSEKLWHCRILQGDRVFVPRGATVTLGYDNRHDTFLLRSPDRESSLLVFGHERRRPFLQRQTIEISAAELESTDCGDDRIAIRRANGRIELLARLRRTDDPAEIAVEESEDEITLSIVPQQKYDALRVRVEPLSSKPFEGEYAFGRNPTALPPIAGITATSDYHTGKLTVRFVRDTLPAPARVLFSLRSLSEDLSPLLDANDAPIVLGLAGAPASLDLSTLVRLASFLADPEPESLSGQLGTALAPAYRSIFAVVGASRTVGSIKPVLNIVRPDGQPPRNDLIGVAPWIFEAPATAFSGLKEDSGLSALARMGDIEPPEPLPPLEGDTPLADWLIRVGSDTSLPAGLGVDALQHAFRALRFRVGDTDLHALVGDGPIAGATKLICGAHIEGLDQIRSFDNNGGGDPLPARIAAQVERFARACAAHRATDYIDDIVFRTGLPREEVGRALTMMLRAGIEFFVYFRALWAHVIQQHLITT
ncbi:hypothetical protein [Rhizobium leucaenae]|uniref:Uncharacterized protein n=1 Tax=Rhizobium leucaenae TaxID=29450 RepID=A0A7W7ENF2_9HYPH|nr:hypothetical protein [Rhizobium leucaenae]MBB4571517.1 hypothetical protein [Rhizobium leucaenae]